MAYQIMQPYVRQGALAGFNAAQDTDLKIKREESQNALRGAQTANTLVNAQRTLAELKDYKLNEEKRAKQREVDIQKLGLETEQIARQQNTENLAFVTRAIDGINTSDDPQAAYEAMQQTWDQQNPGWESSFGAGFKRTGNWKADSTVLNLMSDAAENQLKQRQAIALQNVQDEANMARTVQQGKNQLAVQAARDAAAASRDAADRKGKEKKIEAVAAPVLAKVRDGIPLTAGEQKVLDTYMTWKMVQSGTGTDLHGNLSPASAEIVAGLRGGADQTKLGADIVSRMPESLITDIKNKDGHIAAAVNKYVEEIGPVQDEDGNLTEGGRELVGHLARWAAENTPGYNNKTLSTQDINVFAEMITTSGQLERGQARHDQKQQEKKKKTLAERRRRQEEAQKAAARVKRQATQASRTVSSKSAGQEANRQLKRLDRQGVQDISGRSETYKRRLAARLTRLISQLGPDDPTAQRLQEYLNATQ